MMKLSFVRVLMLVIAAGVWIGAAINVSNVADALKARKTTPPPIRMSAVMGQVQSAFPQLLVSQTPSSLTLESESAADWKLVRAAAYVAAAMTPLRVQTACIGENAACNKGKTKIRVVLTAPS